ncbi:hypothetical protein O181_088270 [Austropuccinia psidii MF-1]|uniref:Uncharacterized protein n=1 Tax=Austropuccinia psidii MF-1 TaxID=1389203 RepID=A0A9Q3P3L4_9BASI|nr:hypothetical protein [Austropuccinia psidii MF-1]
MPHVTVLTHYSMLAKSDTSSDAQTFVTSLSSPRLTHIYNIIISHLDGGLLLPTCKRSTCTNSAGKQCHGAIVHSSTRRRHWSKASLENEYGERSLNKPSKNNLEIRLPHRVGKKRLFKILKEILTMNMMIFQE